MPKYNSYPFKTSPESGDTVLIYDATNNKNKQTYFSNFLSWIVTNIQAATFSGFHTSSKTLEGAVNEIKDSADAANAYIALTQTQKNTIKDLLN